MQRQSLRCRTHRVLLSLSQEKFSPLAAPLLASDGTDLDPKEIQLRHSMSMIRFLAPLLLSLGWASASWATPASLQLKRTSGTYANGDPIWQVQLLQQGQVLQRWKAVASAKQHQNLDRRWSPGNGSPLPKGTYRLGQPEPWGQDLWLQLDPLFPTSRSALGIHNCYPGVGCICIPDREQLSSLADAVRRYNINRLKVVD